MANKLGVGGVRFKPGQSGNPGGRTKLPPDIRKAINLTNAEFTRVANKFLFMTPEQINAILEDPATPMLELLIGGMLHRATEESDHQRATFLLDRLIGKAPVVIDPISINVRDELRALSNQELMRMVREKLPLLTQASEPEDK